ncbi:radical SAM protein [Sorangium sp. So ce134]
MLVLKASSRCNLNCSYCYVYNLGDTTYQQQPRAMPPRVITALLQKIKSHCLRHGMDRFALIFHGGEPLLLGERFYVDFVSEARATLLPEVTPYFSMQTNGTLLTEQWCETLAALDIPIGISLDGPPRVNDQHRVDHAGRGSYEDVIRGFEIARSSPHAKLAPGILTVINIESDPVELYEHFKGLNLRTVDFLLPEATHDRPPHRPIAGRETPYADWLISIFDRWFHEKPKPMSIRMFEGIIAQILGAPSPLDTLGTSRNEVLVIEADGGIEPIGSLKVCGPGFTKLGANVLTHELDDALATELAAAYQLSGEEPSSTCASCPIHEVCGGGYLPHRYSRERMFDNPSVYCRDLMKLITHIQNSIIDELPPPARDRLGLTRLTYDGARATMRAPGRGRVSLPVIG